MQPHIGTIISLDMMLVDPCQNGSELPRISGPLIILLALAFTEGTFSLKCIHFHLLPLASLCRVEFKRTLLLSSGYHIEFNVSVSHHLYSVRKSFINESFLKFFLMNLKVSWDQFSFFLLQMSIFWAHMGIIRWSRKMKKFY